MARFEVGSRFFADFDATPLATANGDIAVQNSHLIRIRAKEGIENFIGDFEYNDKGQPIGTILEYRFVSYTGQRVYTIEDANIDAEELRETAASGGDFLKLIFRGDDSFVGAGLADQMAGYEGNDLLKGRGGNDELSGLTGDDTLFGDIGNDVLFGGSGWDTLRGGTDDDWLDGGRGRNRLTGGEGDDTFVFMERGQPDTVADFGAGDRIALGFGGLGPIGFLDPSSFDLGSEAENRKQHVLYDGDTGWLLHAENGSASDPQKIVRIGKGLDFLGADDILVI